LCADTVYNFPRRAFLLGVGSKLHLRFNMPQRPERVRIVAYEDFDRNKARLIEVGTASTLLSGAWSERVRRWLRTSTSARTNQISTTPGYLDSLGAGARHPH
jgi:hypothetical protein